MNREASGAISRAEILEFIERNHIHIDVVTTTASHRIEKVIRSALELHPQKIIVAGGDGSIRTAVNLMAGKPIALGVLPMGTTNNFARTLGMPLSWQEALRSLAKAQTFTVPIGEVNGVLFPNVASIGLSVEIARATSQSAKQLFGRFAYTMSGLSAGATHEPFSCQVTTPRESLSFITHQLIVANGRYHHATPIAAAASLHRNELILMSFGTNASSWEHLKGFAAFLRGTHEKMPSVRLVSAKELVVLTSPPRPIETDGEIVSRTPAIFKLASHSLNVLIPETAPEPATAPTYAPAIQ